MECSFSNHSSFRCSENKNIQPSTKITSLHSCVDDIGSHISANRVNPLSFTYEYELIKARAGLFNSDTTLFTICPNHRFHLGKGWKSSKLCMMKESIQTCNGKRKIENATLTLQQSKHIWEKFGILIPVGAGVCRQCRSKLIHLDYKSKPVYVAGACDEEYTQPQHSTTNKLQISTDNESPNRNVIPSEDGVDNAYCSNQLNSTTNKLRISTDGESPNRIVIPSKDDVDLAYCSNQLKNLRYVPFSQPPPELENDSELDDKGQQSSQGSCWLPGSQDTDTSDLSEEVEMSGTAKRKALDDFAEKCGLSPIKKQMKINWSEASDRTRSDYLIKTKSILKEVANVLAPCKQIAML